MSVVTKEMLDAAVVFGRNQERERIIKLLEETFYPLDYGRWQGDELMEEIFKTIKGEKNDAV